MIDTLFLPVMTNSFANVDQQLGDTGDLWFQNDMIHRTILNRATTSVQIMSVPTSEIGRRIDEYSGANRADVRLLQKYAAWQRKYIDFQATYAAFLLGAISEEEFETDSEQFSPKIRELDPNSIVGEIDQLGRLLEFELRPVELAEYFETHPSVVNSALQRIHTKIESMNENLNPTLSLTER